MVRLTVANILRGTSIYNKKRVDETSELALKRITHLHLEDMGIDDIGDDIRNCRNLLVLYLYDNKLSQFPNLAGCTVLTHLYLQNNQIQQIDFVQFLPSLQHLYLSRNRISVLEGLHMCTMLEELFIDYQELPFGEKLLFDPRSIAALSRTLRVLNVSGDRVDTLADLHGLMALESFSARDNRLISMRDLKAGLSSWPSLRQLDVANNDVCKRKRYNELVVSMCRDLSSLDGKEINDAFRAFITSMQDRRGTKMGKATSVISTQNGDSLPEPSNLTHNLHFGRLYGPSNGESSASAPPQTRNDVGNNLPRLPRSYADIPAHLRKQKKKGRRAHRAGNKAVQQAVSEVELAFAVTAASAPVHLRQLRKAAELAIDAPANTFENLATSADQENLTLLSMRNAESVRRLNADPTSPVDGDFTADYEIDLAAETTDLSNLDLNRANVSSGKVRNDRGKLQVRFHSAPSSRRRTQSHGSQKSTSFSHGSAFRA